MQLNLKYDDENGTSEFSGSFTETETSFLLQYAVQDLMRKGLLVIQTPNVEEEVAH